MSQSVSNSVTLCAIIFILNIIWLDLIQNIIWNIFRYDLIKCKTEENYWIFWLIYSQLDDFKSSSIWISICLTDVTVDCGGVQVPVPAVQWE